MEVYPCPLCGRQRNRRGNPFEDPTQTAAHIDGSHDAVHKGESSASMTEEIEENMEEVDPADLVGYEREESAEGETVEFYGTEQSLSEFVESVERVVDDHQDQLMEKAAEVRVESLEEQVAEQREVLGELTEMVEILALAVDAEDLEYAVERHADGVELPIEWDTDVYGIQQERYE